MISIKGKRTVTITVEDEDIYSLVQELETAQQLHVKEHHTRLRLLALLKDELECYVVESDWVEE